MNSRLSNQVDREEIKTVDVTKNRAKRLYDAYDKKGKPCHYIEILCITQPSQSLQSRFFMATVFDAAAENVFTLLYSFIAVEIKGRNLKKIREAIQNNQCQFIQEYHESEFLPPENGIRQQSYDKYYRPKAGIERETHMETSTETETKTKTVRWEVL